MISGKKILIGNLLLCSMFIMASAENTNTTTTLASSSIDTVDVTMPLKSSDFLMFYGVTNDKDADTSISDLRKDFINKFNTLKTDYNASLSKLKGDKELVAPSVTFASNNTQSSSTIVSTNTKNLTTKKTILQLPVKKIAVSTPSEEASVPAIVNILNINNESDITNNPENKGWFSKLKSWFK